MAVFEESELDHREKPQEITFFCQFLRMSGQLWETFFEKCLSSKILQREYYRLRHRWKKSSRRF